MKRRLKSIVPRGSKEYKELMATRDQMLKAIDMLEKAKEQILKSQSAEEETKEEAAPIIQKG